MTSSDQTPEIIDNKMSEEESETEQRQSTPINPIGTIQKDQQEEEEIKTNGNPADEQKDDPKVTSNPTASTETQQTHENSDGDGDSNTSNVTSTTTNQQVNVDIVRDDDTNQVINYKLTLTDILINQPLLKPIYSLLSKRTGRLRIQRIIYFMGIFSITHSFLMIVSVLPSSGLIDSFASRLDYMRFTLFLNDVTLFTMLNGVLALDPPFQLLNYLWTSIYHNPKSSSSSSVDPSKNTIEVKQWILTSVSSIRKRLYLLIILSTLIYLQLIISIGLDSTSNLSTFIRLIDITHVTVDLIGLLVVLLLVYQFLISTIFAQSIFRDISEAFKEDKKKFPWNFSSLAPSSTIHGDPKSSDLILARRNRYCGTIEFTRTANSHWKNFLAFFVLSNFIPAVFQLHFILNKQLDEQQLVELIYRFVVNIVATYIVIVNAKRVNHFSWEFYDDLYQLTLRESNDSTRLEALLFLDRVDHGNIGFTLSDAFLITSNLMATLFASLIVLVFILPSI